MTDQPGPMPGGPQRPLPPRRIILEQPMHPFRKVVMSLLILGLVLSVGFNLSLFGSYKAYVQSPDAALQEKLYCPPDLGDKDKMAHNKDKIAIISVQGLISEQEDGFAKQQIDRVRRDDNVKAVVLRVDSPGGTVTGSDYLYHYLDRLRQEKKIPLVVSMGGVAASGGYYLSMAVGNTPDTIYAEPSTFTGSIGVIVPHYDLAGLLEKLSIRDDSIASGPLKQMLSPTRPEPKDPRDIKQREKERAVVQKLVDESFAQFKGIVASGRPKLSQAKLAEVTTGQIFSAKQAQELGLIDKIGFLDDAIKQAVSMAKLNLADVRVVEYKKPKGLLEEALGGQQSSSESGAAQKLSALLDLTAPRAYYLFTWLPAAVGTRQE